MYADTFRIPKPLLDRVRRTVRENGMEDRLCAGVLLGLSGGADSVFLLYTLLSLRAFYGGFPIVCAHVHHGIRGKEADRDAAFCSALCDSLRVPFYLLRAEVPAFAKERGIGEEEAGRILRYQKFREIICSRNDIRTIAVAHNADDQIETVLFRIFRGCGTHGLCGIPAVRDNIIRPLIDLSFEEIRTTLSTHGIGFVTDSTNLDDGYMRNRIRLQLLPFLHNFFSDYRESILRLSRNVKYDDACLAAEAARVTEKVRADGTLPLSEVRELPRALLVRVLHRMASRFTPDLPEECHVRMTEQALRSGEPFSVDLPGGLVAAAEGDRFFVGKKAENAPVSYRFPLSFGHTELTPYAAAVDVAENDNFSDFVYKISTQVRVSSVIIKRGIYLREKRDGDTIFYHGKTHRLKKMFNDRGIPPSLRKRIPVFCDPDGIFWVPGYHLRDGVAPLCEEDAVTLRFSCDDGADAAHRLYTGGQFPVKEPSL